MKNKTYTPHNQTQALPTCKIIMVVSYSLFLLFVSNLFTIVIYHALGPLISVNKHISSPLNNTFFFICIMVYGFTGLQY